MDYKVFKIENENNIELGNATIDVSAVAVVYDVLDSMVNDTLKSFVDDGSIESEDKAMMVANVINNNVNQSMNSLLLGKDIALKDIQKQFNEQTLPFRIEGVKTDKDRKTEQLLTEQLKNGKVTFNNVFYKSYYDKNGNIIETDKFLDADTTVTVGNDTFILFKDFSRLKDRTIESVGGISMVEIQKNDLVEKTKYTKTQREELIKSVIANNKKLGGELVEQLVSSISVGGMVVPENGYKSILEIANDLTGGLVGTITFKPEEIKKIE